MMAPVQKAPHNCPTIFTVYEETMCVCGRGGSKPRLLRINMATVRPSDSSVLNDDILKEPMFGENSHQTA